MLSSESCRSQRPFLPQTPTHIRFPRRDEKNLVLLSLKLILYLSLLPANRSLYFCQTISRCPMYVRKEKQTSLSAPSQTVWDHSFFYSVLIKKIQNSMLISTAAAFSTTLLYEHNLYRQICPHMKLKMLIYFSHWEEPLPHLSFNEETTSNRQMNATLSHK